MKQSLMRSLSLFTRSRLLYKLSHCSQLALSTRPRSSFYSTTESESHNPEVSKDEEDDDVSNEELKMRIDNFFKGNNEAIPTIFEAILKRKLTGKHEQTDEKLMEELCGKKEGHVVSDSDDEDYEDEEIDSDFDELYGDDEKAADLNQAMDRLMKEMPIKKREN